MPAAACVRAGDGVLLTVTGARVQFPSQGLSPNLWTSA